MRQSTESRLGPINCNETVSRFICYSKFIRDNNTLKADAFRERREGIKISIFRIDGLKEAQIWLIGKQEVAEKKKRNLYGRGDLSVHSIKTINLDRIDANDKKSLVKELKAIGKNVGDVSVDVEEAPELHPRHADITYDPFIKSIEKHIAKKLARLSSLRKPSLKYIQDLGLQNIMAESAN